MPGVRSARASGAADPHCPYCHGRPERPYACVCSLGHGPVRASVTVKLPFKWRGDDFPDPLEYTRPRTRAECLALPRPCPYAGCRYHLYLEMGRRLGCIKVNQPHLQAWQLPCTCALDVADEGPHTLDEVGILLGLTRERVRQLEAAILAKLKGPLRDRR